MKKISRDIPYRVCVYVVSSYRAERSRCPLIGDLRKRLHVPFRPAPLSHTVDTSQGTRIGHIFSSAHSLPTPSLFARPARVRKARSCVIETIAIMHYFRTLTGQRGTRLSRSGECPRHESRSSAQIATNDPGLARLTEAERSAPARSSNEDMDEDELEHYIPVLEATTGAPVQIRRPRRAPPSVPQIRRQHSSFVEICSCPCCGKTSRPRSMETSATECIARHVADKSRQGCEKHRMVREMIMSVTREDGLYQCIACTEGFATRHEAFRHLETTQDEAHARCRIAEEERGRVQTERVAADAQRPEVRPGLGAQAIAVAQSSAHTDPAAAARMLAQEERERRQEKAAQASLYAAAKMGHVDACVAHLARGVDPNTTHDDGFTPLMTAAEAGHAEVVRLLGDCGQCNPTLSNAYGQTALHFAAQNGRRDAAAALLDSSAGHDALAKLLNATSGGCTAAEKARLAGYTTLADDLAARAAEMQLARLVEELTAPAVGLRWARCARGLPPPSSTAADELNAVEHSVLADALAAKRAFTARELASLGIDRSAVRPSSFIRVGARAECYAPVGPFGAASGPFDSLQARLIALCQAVDVPLPGARGKAGAPYGDDDDDDGPLALDDGLPTCCICLSEHVDTALKPCFHASFCAGCARSLLAKRSVCPIGRCTVSGTQRIFL